MPVRYNRHSIKKTRCYHRVQSLVCVVLRIAWRMHHEVRLKARKPPHRKEISGLEWEGSDPQIVRERLRRIFVMKRV
ncbi:hypothetical protein CBM2617_A70143 [Cupriavidus taiwanensis]|nr:hypothetical protein CBM2591_A90165 [Cupriavidus taiwanensis]SOZ63616.1 hypothetical protein CBM2617_A70143 [Cupriavidus taiwanensis]SOZ82629.1 hypothetical protein CBM2618_A80143 [Cupriavidus taiwanensis]SOZ84464.1 hypothetical protein CBM2622_A80143 [Cupriavidus taiwanensis]SOZ92207.1 hypothetical protein CBM2621_A80142 [Cupriavidus taiwanensis]